MDALGAIHVVDEATDLCQRLIKIAIVRQIDFFFLERANHAFGKAILGRFTNSGHTDLDASLLQEVDILRRGILNALVAVVNARGVILQRSPEGRRRQLLRKRARELPATDIASE